jgi:hypothetical protein
MKYGCGEKIIALHYAWATHWHLTRCGIVTWFDNKGMVLLELGGALRWTYVCDLVVEQSVVC